MFAPLYYFHCPLCLTLCDMWALTMRRSFHTPKVSGIGYLKGEGLPNTHSRLFSSLRINYWHVVVRPKDGQTFRWAVWWIFQLTKRPPDTPLQSNVWLIQTLCTHACVRKGKLKVPDHVKVQVTCVLETWLWHIFFKSIISIFSSAMPVLQIDSLWCH